jgi:phospholipid-translocating ATPase
MGVLVRSEGETGAWFVLKGADSAVLPMCRANEWVEEEVSNMAREGLRTLVYAARNLSDDETHRFLAAYSAARASLVDREARVRQVVAEYLVCPPPSLISPSFTLLSASGECV